MLISRLTGFDPMLRSMCACSKRPVSSQEGREPKFRLVIATSPAEGHADVESRVLRRSRTSVGRTLPRANSRRSEGLAGSLIVAIASTPQVGSAGLYSDRATTCLCLEPGGHGNFDL